VARLVFGLLLALSSTAALFAQEELQGKAQPHVNALNQAVERMVGVQYKSETAAASCTAPKGALTLGQTTHPFLGDTGSCFQSGVWLDLWTFSAQGGSQVRTTFSSTYPSLATIQDYTSGVILASSDAFCSGLATSCTFDYTIPSSGQYYFGFASLSTENYTVTLSLVTGGGGGSGPNLTPFKPTGWSDKIVVSNVTGTHTDSSVLGTSDTLYVDWAIVNNGTGTRPAVNKSASLYVDGVLKQSWSSSSPLDPNNYGYYEDYSIGSLSAGSHTIRIQADPDNEVPETNETDNDYTKTINVGGTGGGGCSPSATSLCLNSSRFRVSVDWNTLDGRSGQGQAIALTGDTGYFWFFSSANVELVVKVLDGRSVTGHFWVFYGALSNVHYTIRVTDTQSGVTKTYENPQGTLASVADTSAF
jgi:hypothetical protein